MIDRRLGALVILAMGGLGLGLWLFPGQRLGMAWTLGTGLGRDRIQARIDEQEARAIASLPPRDEDRRFLSDFYRTLATGAKLTLLVRQTGLLMDHYLDGTGEPFRVAPDIFRNNAKVQAQLAVLRAEADRGGCVPGRAYTSARFYMPDASVVDSMFGLYWGTVAIAHIAREASGCRLRYRAVVPWTWPSYSTLEAQYGTPYAERFPIPNAVSLLLGRRHALYVGNGLGHHLSRVGLAKEFVAYSEWDE